MTGCRGWLSELFTSIQGEGPHAGRLHHFLRLGGCGLGCAYCDTERAKNPSKTVRIAGRDEALNPVSPEMAVSWVAGLDAQNPGASALAVTGGEPLEQVDFLEAFLAALRGGFWKDRTVLLETAGLHPEALKRVIGSTDLVSMDLKLPSMTGRPPCWDRHREFIEAMGEGACCFKVVVDERVPVDEIETAAGIASVRPEAPFFIQPLTRPEGPAGGAYLLVFREVAARRMEDVRVLPQVHPLLGLE